MIDQQELKRRKMMEAMAASLSTPTPNPNDVSINSRSQVNPVIPEPGTGLRPPELEGQQSDVPTNVRVGFGAGGLHGVDRDMLKRQAQQEADPESKVTDTGDFIDIAPPRGVNEKPPHGLLSRLGRGASIGLASGDPDNPNSILGSLIGSTLGSVSPRGAAKIERKYDIGQTENDITRGLKLEQEQSQLGGMRALETQRGAQPGLAQQEIDRKAQYDNERLRIEEDRVHGLLTKAEADSKNRELDRKSREDVARLNRENQKAIAGMPARSRPPGEKDDVKGPKYRAAQVELDELTNLERIAGEAKDKAYAAYSVAKQKYKDNPDIQEDVIAAKKAADDAQAHYESFGEKKAKAKAAMAENESSSARALDPALEKKIRDAAKAKGLDPDIAVQRALARQ